MYESAVIRHEWTELLKGEGMIRAIFGSLFYEKISSK